MVPRILRLTTCDEMLARTRTPASARRSEGTLNGKFMKQIHDEYYPVKPIMRGLCGSKHRKTVMYERVGRLYRAEKRYRYQRDHFGKGVTLRSHRMGSVPPQNADRLANAKLDWTRLCSRRKLYPINESGELFRSGEVMQLKRAGVLPWAAAM